MRKREIILLIVGKWSIYYYKRKEGEFMNNAPVFVTLDEKIHGYWKGWYGYGE